jgi:FtsZ-binding cell division protein ZapB
MEISSELDRLEQCVKRAFERIDTLQDERQRLATEKSRLENRLNDVVPSRSASVQASPALSAERLSEIKKRLANLIEEIKEYERKL